MTFKKLFYTLDCTAISGAKDTVTDAQTVSYFSHVVK